jgi:hypothetical protein
MFYRSLEEITRHESGAIQYSDGAIWIGNWAGMVGIPRLFATGMIDWPEALYRERVAAPKEVVQAMRMHAIEVSGDDYKTGYKAWAVNGDTIVVVHKEWA